MMIRARVLLLALLPLGSCGPIPVEQAEAICYNDARLAQQPRGAVGFGMDSRGRTAAGISLSISSDYLLGRDPDAVYSSCVYQRSGQMPTRPFSSLPPPY